MEKNLKTLISFIISPLVRLCLLGLRTEMCVFGVLVLFASFTFLCQADDSTSVAVRGVSIENCPTPPKIEHGNVDFEYGGEIQLYMPRGEDYTLRCHKLRSEAF